MKNKTYKYSKIPISDWKHGEKHSLKVDQLTIGKLLDDEYEDLIPANILDNLYYHLLDSKAIRKKLRKKK
jgi:hypothetical protein